MLSFVEIANECGVSVDDVRSAWNMAERFDLIERVPRLGPYEDGGDDIKFRRVWFVNSDDGVKYGIGEQRFSYRYGGMFDTKTEAVMDDLSNGWRAGRGNWRSRC
ncbi:hypothetical protein [Bifidobacterium eulemuris]|uniref:Uncharacterized protein n=1 Tax=Bifidobacterium eulemuris TaxID=1765219 RepID=A0A261G9Y8_9BIFI|nr:hypothetical protein [Bifidobacterium eulemuris]OZG68247.1 hypothetical protein BEUL_1260 [Bifidobacterium eulemuris]QOL31697.1 hypothetical protein BE0216_03890 [Bifidobacterium eulemuris]